MSVRERPVLSADEARALHRQAFVIDTQQPWITCGMPDSADIDAELEALAQGGMTIAEIIGSLGDIVVRELRRSPEARTRVRQIWRESGVTAACGTYSRSSAVRRFSLGFETTVASIAAVHGFCAAMDGDVFIARRAADLERAHAEDRHAVVIDFQDVDAVADDLDRLDLFYNLGLRMCQLTYNLHNLVGDGCTERYQGGLTYFGREFVARLNALGILVDVSHSSEQVGWDAMAVSRSPVIVSHSAAKAVTPHDRNKSDALAKAIADQGGYFGVVIAGMFISESSTGAAIADFVRHVEHLVQLIGVDHLGIATDVLARRAAMFTLPNTPYRRAGTFSWEGFRPEHRITPEANAMDSYTDFRDWSNLTVALAAAGFNEDELRKILGLNYLRVFRDVCG